MTLLKNIPSVKILAILLSIPATYQSAHSQDAEQAAEKAQGISVRALLLSQGSPNIDLVTMAGERISEPCNVGTSGLSQPLFPGAASFHLGVKDSSSESGYRKVADITLPAGGKDYILLLEPKGGEQFGSYVINGRDRSFGPDSTLFFNASSKPVGVTMGSKKKVLASRRIEIMQAPAPQGELPFYQVQLFYSDGATPRLFASSRWLHRDDGRNYVFIYRASGSDRITYKTFDETIQILP